MQSVCIEQKVFSLPIVPIFKYCSMFSCHLLGVLFRLVLEFGVYLPLSHSGL